MASTIKIKRSGTAAGSPASLKSGELAYTYTNGVNRLYYGKGDDGSGNATEIVQIAGQFFTDMLDHTAGTLTANSAIIVDSNSKIDTIKAGNLQLTGNIFSSTTGDISIAPTEDGDLLISTTGTGTISIAGQVWPSSDGSANQYLKTNGSGQLSWAAIPSGSFDITDGSNTDTFTTGQTLTFTGAGSVTTAVTDNTVTITGTDTNTTYSQSAVTTTGGAFLRLTGSDASTDDVKIASGTNVSVAFTDANTITISSTDTNTTYSAGNGIGLTSTTFSVAAGSGLTQEANGLAHSDTSSVGNLSSDNSGATFIQDISLTFDGFGHVTGATAGTGTVPTATTSTLGIASFDTSNFTVTAGAVSTKSVTIGSTSINSGSTSTTLAGLTEVTIDNININGNEISSTNTDGDISLNPNGNGSVDVNGARITTVGSPTDANDAANKAYVDNAVTGLTFKPAVNLLATTNVGLTGSTGTLVIDGHAALDVNDDGVYRLLLTGQTTDSQNGIYVYTDNGTSYTLVRAEDADTFAELDGASVFVQEGTVYGNTGWVQTNHYLTDFSGQTWVQFSGAGAYSAGNGLTQSGTIFNVGAGDGITVGADTVSLASTVAGAGLTYTTGVINVVGTTNRITANANSIDIASTYVGQASITTLGTITTGTWNGTTIAVPYGGTGLTTATSRGIIYGNGTGAFGVTAASSTDGSILMEDSTGNPYWSNIIDGGTF